MSDVFVIMMVVALCGNLLVSYQLRDRLDAILKATNNNKS